MRRELRKRSREGVEFRTERRPRKNCRRREEEVNMDEEELRNGKIAQSIISNLPLVDLTALKEPCVIMHTRSREVQGYDCSKLLAWFPERRYVGVVTNTLLSHKKYIHLASSGGFLCGLHMSNICNVEDFEDWTLKLAVCNPATGFKMKLPRLDADNDKEDLPPGLSYYFGNLEVNMSPVVGGDRNQFRVHVVHKVRLVCTVYTYNSGSQGWESSSTDPNAALTGHLAGEFIFRRTNLHAYDVTSRTWTAIAYPGKDLNDYPLPPELLGDRYYRLHLFRYGSRVLMLGAADKSLAVVLLELEKDGTSWKIVTWAPRLMVPSELILPDFDTPYPLVCGKVLVLPCGWFLVPMAFDLEENTWLRLPNNVPTDVKPLPLQTNCVYNP